MNFTFQRIKDKPFVNDWTKVKLNNKTVGMIIQDAYNKEIHKIILHVKRNPTENDDSPFISVRLQKNFTSEYDAREFLYENFEDLICSFILHQLDN